MMRILHVTDVYEPQVGGIELFVRDLATRQTATGHDVTVLTSQSPGRPIFEARPGALDVVRASRPPKTAAGRRLVREGDWDAVHLHLSVLSPFSSLVGRAATDAGIPTVHTVHSMWGGRVPVVRVASAVAGWDASPAVWTAVSSVAAEEMRQVLSRTTPVLVVPNAVDVEWWRQGIGDPRPPSRAFTVISVMRLSGRKRPLALMRMLRELRAQVPSDVELRAIIIGDGPKEARLLAARSRWGLADWVALPGRLSRDEIRRWCRDADAYVAPAFQESFGIAALEARAAGLPVIAMESGGVGEFIGHGLEGLLCSSDREMVQALAALATDPARREAMAAHNRAHPPALDWAVTLSGFEDAYAVARGRQSGNRQVAGAILRT
jgi:glycosyltransferase involved in cell wall biosynthesis